MGVLDNAQQYALGRVGYVVRSREADFGMCLPCVLLHAVRIEARSDGALLDPRLPLANTVGTGWLLRCRVFLIE
jgi:hypothetical protein